MLGREKFIIGCAPERSGKGVIDCDAKGAAFEPCPNINLSVITVFLFAGVYGCLLYTSPSPRDLSTSRMPSSA